ncbi:flavodoxin family protein [Chitinimonas sp.]|uniref:flavodoxin family protein n=1 Tax=Chitinimonas sp. TaxID=1934313 RepID=UPI002F942ECB
MTHTLIVFHSGTGSTAQLAEAARQGAAEIGTASLLRINGADIVDGRWRNESLLAELDEADAVLFGTPTYMGGPSAQFKAFADATGGRWERQALAGKLAGGFTIGSSLNGDQLQTLHYLSILASQHGMLWCNLAVTPGRDPLGRNPLGTQLGVTAQNVEGRVADAYIETARYLGRRIARMASRYEAAVNVEETV